MKRAIRAGITGALLVGGVAGLTAMSTISPVPMASGDVSVEPDPYVERTPFGTLELQTGPDGQLTIVVDEIGATPVSADFSARKPRCKVDVGALGEYLGLEVVSATVVQDTSGGDVVSESPISPTPDVGLVDQGLGSRDQNNCNRSNGRLEDGQGFAITLGSMFDDVVFDYGVLDIEAKYGADLFAQTTLLGGTPTTYFDPLSNASDNDADAQGADNNLVEIGAEPTTAGEMGTPDDDFDRLVILPTSSDARGQISLEGGGDYADPVEADANRTVFHLVRSKTYEYTLVCDAPVADDGTYPPNGDGEVKGIVETPAELDWSILEDPDGTVDYPSSTRVFRYAGFQTVEGVRVEKECPAIGANLSADDGGVLLEPSTENAFLRVEVTWVIPAALVDLAKGDADGDPFARQIDVDGDGPGLPEPARYCDSFDGTDSFDPGAAGDASHPADTPWCVLTDERTLTQIDPDGEGELPPVDVVIQRMVWDGEGDPRFF